MSNEVFARWLQPLAQGLYLVIEGDEGSGKTTQIHRLRRRLQALGLTTDFVREPGGDPISEQLREIVKFSEEPITAQAELGIFSAARANMLEHVVKPKLEQGHWVLSDRSKLSTYVYQGYGRGLWRNDDFVRIVEYFAAIVPAALTVVIDVPLSTTTERLRKRLQEAGDSTSTDRFDHENQHFRSIINQGYRDMAEGNNVVIVDGAHTEDEVEAQIWQRLCSWINWKFNGASAYTLTEPFYDDPVARYHIRKILGVET